MKTQTSPYGRNVKEVGMPIKVSEMLATLDSPYYIERVAIDSVKGTNATKKAIKKALQYQLEGKGFSFVEIIAACPTYWGTDATESLEWIKKNMYPRFPLGVYKEGRNEHCFCENKCDGGDK
jgi:2-oxoglutarate ferredoxin oxidoreductase subunit beta